MNILIAAGGTAGHINPALSVAQYLKRKRPNDNILFVGAKGGMEETMVPKAGFEIATITAHGIRRGLNPANVFKNIRSVLSLPLSGREADRILKSFKPDVCFGTGGYASYSVLRRAARLRIPTAIHESNALPGLVTRRLAREADCVMLAFEASFAYFKGYDHVMLTGNPLREGVVFGKKADARKQLGIAQDTKYVVSFWGSLGAREMNRAMADFILLESKESREKRFEHIHATGSFGWKWMPGLIREKGVELSENANIRLVEYIHDMPLRLSAADLVICRAGAMTLSELCAAGRASIIIPSPNVTDNHQEKNARALEQNGACEVILEENVTGETLYKRARAILEDEEKLKSMSKNALAMGVFDAAERIAEKLILLTKTKK